jgi:hypothetical protein
MRYYGECQDALDEARDISPKNEDLPEVRAARAAIEKAHTPKPPGSFHEPSVEPGIAPGERPLQRTP